MQKLSSFERGKKIGLKSHLHVVDWRTIKLTSFQYSMIVPTVQSWSEHSAVKS